MRKKSQKNCTHCEYEEEYTDAGFPPPPYVIKKHYCPVKPLLHYPNSSNDEA